MLRRPKFRKRGATHGERHRLARLEVLEPRCVLSAPTLAPIPNVTLYAGAPLHIALDGFDADGDALTYSASSTGAALTTTIPQGNRSMKISVENYGDMVVELFEDLAPRTTQRIVELADSKFYDRLTFHRVIDGVMIVGGDPQGTGLGGSGVLFDDEFHPDLQHTGSGVLSMAKGSDDTNDSQFLITDAAARQLDFNHTVFGFLTAGEDVRDRINSTPADEWNRPLTPIVMDSVSVFHDEENGVLRLAAPHGASGQADVTVTVSDGQGGDAQQTFRVSILPDPSNSPPFLLPIQAIRTSIDTAFQVSIPAQDIENDSIYYAGAGSPANPNLQVDVNASTGNVVVTPKNGLMGVHGMVAMVRAVNGNTWDSQAVPIYVAPNAPTQLQLLSSADTGRSTSDRITNLDNGDGRTLRFVVSGLVPGAEVSLYAGDQRIGQAVAAATSATLETNGNVDLLDGVYSITASQTLANQAVNVGNLHTHVNLLSRPSLPVSITVDTLAPQFLSTPVAEAGEEVEYVYEPQTDDDANGQPAYALLEAPDGMAVDPTSGRLTWTPTTAQRGNHAVTLEVADLAGNATQQQFELAVMPVNRPPELDLPAERTVPQNIDVAIAGIRVFDPDAGAADIEVSCRVDHGTLALKTDVVGGLTAADIAGNGTADVVLTGSPVRINATLAASGGLSYRSTTGYVGRDTLTITADDKGNVGAGGAKTAAGEVVITVGSAASNQLLPGTPQDDLVTITPGEIPGQWIADVNGTLYWLVGNNVSATFDGIDGYDTVNFVGGGGPDMAVLRPTTAELSGPGYSISIANVDAIDYQGGDGEDTVTIWGSKGTNRYYANPGTGEMTGDGVSIFARAENIYARGNGGGDTVLFGDSPGDDVLEYFPIWARMRGEGYFHHVRGFRTMEADAERGINGTDRVVFRGSGLNDFLLVMPASARFLSGTGSVWHIARGFDTIVGYGRGGKQIDELILRDTPGDDAFKLEPLLATLTTPDYTVTAHGFGTVRAVRQNLNAADDQMALSGSKSDDTLIGNPEEVTLGSDQLGYSNTAVGFPVVRAYSSGEGHDVARFSDVTGPTDSRTESDTFTANPMVAQLAGPGYHLWARLFDEVYAEAKSGRDVANLTGNSNPDQLLATAEEVSLSGTNSVSAYIHRVRFFDEVNAFSGTGQDKATLTGAAVESTYGPPDGVALENLPQVLWLNQFPVIELQSGEITDVGRVFAYWGGPAIGGLNISPNPVIRGNALTLSATGVADGDGTVTKVEFYRDVNQNGAIDPSTDILLGADTAGTDGWTWTASTSDFPTGTNAFLARAQDDDLLWSGTASATVLVNAPVKQSPTIGSLGLSPNRVVRPAPITLTANSVVDPDGQVETVEFYRDANGNGTLETDTDELLGTDIDGSDGWTWAGPTTNFPTGFNRYFARAQDNDDRWSNTVTATGVVTLSNLQDSELPKASSNPPDVVNSGGKRYEFDVHYTDNVALDVSTLGNSDIRVYCPQNGFNKTATFLRFTPETGGASVTATYYITPPGGSWDSIDNAVYQVLMVAGQVSDTSGHDVESGLLGEFVVNVPPSIASSFPAFTPLGTAASANETDDSMNREIEIAYLDTAFADW